MTDTLLTETEKLLRTACEKLALVSGDQPLTAATTRLVECALEAVTLLKEPEPGTALEVMSCARAAVTAATYAVREVDGRERYERSGRSGRRQHP
ncbi:hypothetical protein AB0I60_00795 [Actinosynnema sp. NPDC050436]|uniref:hypothetical protein n=1 Tax=Actinosynnema sp. NPDC050436 TaxID=3155659 RepID=UPI00340F5093